LSLIYLLFIWVRGDTHHAVVMDSWWKWIWWIFFLRPWIVHSSLCVSW